jgi:hypothetical protein
MSADDEERVTGDGSLVSGSTCRGARRIEDGVVLPDGEAAVRLRSTGARASRRESTRHRLERLRHLRSVGVLRHEPALVTREERDMTLAIDREPVAVEASFGETDELLARLREVHALERVLAATHDECSLVPPNCPIWIF